MIKYNESMLIPQPLMCVPSCILLILDRLNLLPEYLKDKDSDIQQFLIASKLDLRIPENKVEYFKSINIPFTISTSKINNGVNIKDLNKQLFEPMDIPLKEKFYSIKELHSDLELIKEKIKEGLDNDNDVLIFLDYSTLSFEKEIGPIGHCMLASDLKGDYLVYTNPVTERMVVTDGFHINDTFLESLERMGSAGGISIIEKKYGN